MKLAIMQPYFFPYIGYYQLIAAVDKFVIYDDVNYIKRGWINRNRILLNGAPHTFTIPVLKASQNVSIAEIRIDPAMKWRKKLMVSVEHAYKNAPFFSEVYPMIEKTVFNDCASIGAYALESIKAVVNYLGIDTMIEDSSSIYSNQDLKGSNRILDICLKEKATTYINPPGGAALYDTDTFKHAGIELNFIHTEKIEYAQFNGEFIENLSMIDVLMFNSPKETKKLLTKYRLA